MAFFASIGKESFTKLTRRKMKINSEACIYGVVAVGRTSLIRYRNGEKLTLKKACNANCYDCMGGYTDGRYSCMIEGCPLYPYMPYKDVSK